MNRVGATIGSVALLLALTVPGQANAVPSPTPEPPTLPGPADPSPAAGPLPGPAPEPDVPPADPTDPQAEGLPVLDSGNPVKDACDVFFSAGNLAASNYEDFADASEGSGNDMNYGDPEVERTSAISRIALRQAAAAANEAANLPGVPPEVADPMRSWSFHVTKLIVVVSLRAGRNTVNDTVNQVNVDYANARQACAMTLAHGG